MFPISLAKINIISVTLFTPPWYSLSRPSVWVLSRSRSVPRRVSYPSPTALDRRWQRDSWNQTGKGLIKNYGRVLEKLLADINSIYVTCSFYLWVLDQVSTDG